MRESIVREIITRMLKPLRERVLMLATRVVVSAIDDSKKVQVLQVKGLADEDLADIEHFQNFGFTSHAPKNSEALMISIGGNREHSIVIALENREKRFKDLEEGESVQYFDDKNYFAVRKGGKFEVKNDSNELIEVLVDLVQAIIDARTATLGGPQPLLNIKNPFPQIKRQLKTFKY